MAQWKSSPHDLWPTGLANALRLLRSAADTWSFHGKEALCVDGVAEVLIEALMYPLSAATMHQSVAQCFEPVRLAARWHFSLSQQPPRRRVPAALMELNQLLTMSAHEWAEGDPEKPPTAIVLHEIASIMFRHRMVLRPPPPVIGTYRGEVPFAYGPERPAAALRPTAGSS